MTEYSDIFDRFENKIQDKDLGMLEEDDQTEQLCLWLNSALAYMELDGITIKSDLSKRDDYAQAFEDDLTNVEIEIIALYMVVAWYDIRINSLEHTLMFFGSKDEKWTNQKDHLNAIKQTQATYRKRAKNYLINFASRNNSYLGNKND